MNIIIAGVGKIGKTLAKQLTAEGHNLTLIDAKSQVLESTVEAFDAMGVCGNCASMEVLKSAGIEETDLVIAVTNADEVNLLCCLTAHGLNPNVHTIARIRDPEYAEQIMAMRDVFPLSMTVNPEKRAAREIERLLKFPGFLRRESFAKGRVEIVELRVEKNSPLNNVSLMDMRNVVKCKVLVCAVLRDGEAVAPSGNFVLREGDRIFVTAATSELALLLKNLGIITHRVRKVLLCGGGKVSFYLAKLLEKGNMDVRLLEKNYERCVELAEDLPGTSVIHGDCSNMNVLEAQGFDQCDALVSLTGLDETNMIVALYGENRGVRQIITKISREENGSIANELALGSVINPRELCSNHIVRYVRAMENQVGAAVSVHAIADGKAEAVEFLVDDATKNCGVALKEIKLKKNVLLAVINRGTKTQIPNGDSYFQKGDSVVVVTSGRGILRNINDIFA
ncbi:MAG: Trk system potassium transporter TrkA [Oscillospiraceae bacterium]|nr:Trk system potassium transporter TrkA [Oscillospiraceae bacterium]